MVHDPDMDGQVQAMRFGHEAWCDYADAVPHLGHLQDVEVGPEPCRQTEVCSAPEASNVPSGGSPRPLVTAHHPTVPLHLGGDQYPIVSTVPLDDLQQRLRHPPALGIDIQPCTRERLEHVLESGDGHAASSEGRLTGEVSEMVSRIQGRQSIPGHVSDVPLTVTGTSHRRIVHQDHFTIGREARVRLQYIDSPRVHGNPE